MFAAVGDDPWATRDGARRARYREYLDFYEGQQWVGRPLPGERRLTVNYARALVRKSVSYLFPEPVTFAVTPALHVISPDPPVAQERRGLHKNRESRRRSRLRLWIVWVGRLW